jgi:hypothetical protein
VQIFSNYYVILLYFLYIFPIERPIFCVKNSKSTYNMQKYLLMSKFFHIFAGDFELEDVNPSHPRRKTGAQRSVSVDIWKEN